MTSLCVVASVPWTSRRSSRFRTRRIIRPLRWFASIISRTRIIRCHHRATNNINELSNTCLYLCATYTSVAALLRDIVTGLVQHWQTPPLELINYVTYTNIKLHIYVYVWTRSLFISNDAAASLMLIFDIILPSSLINEFKCDAPDSVTQ